MNGRMDSDIVTGEQSVCVQCDEPIGAVIDPISGMVDWGAYDGATESPCDFDCNYPRHEGTGSHDPGPGHTPQGFIVPGIDRRTRGTYKATILLYGKALNREDAESQMLSILPIDRVNDAGWMMHYSDVALLGVGEFNPIDTDAGRS